MSTGKVNVCGPAGLTPSGIYPIWDIHADLAYATLQSARKRLPETPGLRDVKAP
jgi:hypothetical protein